MNMVNILNEMYARRWNKIIILIETYLWESRAGGIIWFSPQETLNINDSLMYKLILDWTKGKSFLFRSPQSSKSDMILPNIILKALKVWNLNIKVKDSI